MNELSQAKKTIPSTKDVDGSWDVFLSYAAEDTEWVKLLANKLKSLHLRVFDPYSTPPEFWGQSRDEIITTIFPATCPTVFILLSGAYTASVQSTHELAIILEAALGKERSLVLPAHLDDSPIPEPIRSVAILDARSTSPEAVAERVEAKSREWKARRQSERTGITSPVIEVAKETPLSGLEVSEQFDHLRRAIDMLSDRERQIIMMKYFDELTFEEVASRIGVSEVAAHRLLRRAMLRLHAVVRSET